MTTKMTKKDLRNWIDYANRNGLAIKRGYCCRYEREDKACELVQLGYNSGIYGWNWSLYIDDNALYIDGYRNY